MRCGYYPHFGSCSHFVFLFFLSIYAFTDAGCMVCGKRLCNGRVSVHLSREMWPGEPRSCKSCCYAPTTSGRSIESKQQLGHGRRHAVIRGTRIDADLFVLLVHSIYYSIPKDVCFTRVIYFFILFYFLLAVRSQNQRMDGSWVCYRQSGVWCNFKIP